MVDTCRIVRTLFEYCQLMIDIEMCGMEMVPYIFYYDKNSIFTVSHSWIKWKQFENKM